MSEQLEAKVQEGFLSQLMRKFGIDDYLAIVPDVANPLHLAKYPHETPLTHAVINGLERLPEHKLGSLLRKLASIATNVVVHIKASSDEGYERLTGESDHDIHWWREILLANGLAFDHTVTVDGTLWTFTSDAKPKHFDPRLEKSILNVKESLGFENTVSISPVRSAFSYKLDESGYVRGSDWAYCQGAACPLHVNAYDNLHALVKLVQNNKWRLLYFPSFLVDDFTDAANDLGMSVKVTDDWQEAIASINWVLQLKGSKFQEMRTALRRYEDYPRVSYNTPSWNELLPQLLLFLDSWLPWVAGRQESYQDVSESDGLFLYELARGHVPQFDDMEAEAICDPETGLVIALWSTTLSTDSMVNADVLCSDHGLYPQLSEFVYYRASEANKHRAREINWGIDGLGDLTSFKARHSQRSFRSVRLCLQ